MTVRFWITKCDVNNSKDASGTDELPSQYREKSLLKWASDKHYI